MPDRFQTENGRHPEFAELYGAKEFPSPEYPPRTRANVSLADAVVIFDTTDSRRLEDMSRGTQLAIRTAMKFEKPSLVVKVDLSEPPAQERRVNALVAFLGNRLGGKPGVMMIGGNRESNAIGIGAWVERHLTEVFRVMKGTHDD